MIIKNYSLKTLLWVLPVRTWLELVNLIYALITGNLKWAWAIVRSITYLLIHVSSLMHKHRSVQKLRKVDDISIRQYMYKPSIVWAYFISRKNSYQLFIKMHKN